MTNTLKRYAVALLSLAASFSASATTVSADYTDQWWNPSESGWGVNFIQQNDVIFATLFVYGASGTPTWYVATMRPSGAAFSGPLSATTGPYFGAASFNPGTVGVTTVGAMTVAFANQYSGTLTYSVAGVGNVTKSIVRQTFADQNIGGKYLGGLTAQGTSCQNSPNGPILIFDVLEVTQTGKNVSMLVKFNTQSAAAQCTFAGALTAQGRVAQITNGTWNCTFGGSPGNVGTFTIDMLDASQQGFTSRFTGRDQFCTYNGFFGGVRDVL